MLHISETLSILIFILPVETRLENGILSSVKPLLLLFYLMDILHFTFLYILTVYSTFYVSDTFDGYCSW